MSSPYNKFNSAAAFLANGGFNLAADTLKLALFTNASAPAATDSTYTGINGRITQVTGANGYTTTGTAVTGVSSTQTGGTYTLSCSQVVFTAAGGTIPNIEYAVLYDSTSGNLIAWWDYGSAVTLNSGDTFTWQPNGASSAGTVFTLV